MRVFSIHGKLKGWKFGAKRQSSSTIGFFDEVPSIKMQKKSLFWTNFVTSRRFYNFYNFDETFW